MLAIYPNSRGFAFAAFEGPLAPYDWGVKEVRGSDRNRRCLRAVEKLLKRLDPSLIVLQDMTPQGTRRARRIKSLNAEIAKFAAKCGFPVFAYSRDRVREAFEGPEATKETIAQAISKHIPAFERHLPPARTPWKSDDARMGLFDAAALAITFFQDGAEPLGSSAG